MSTTTQTITPQRPEFGRLYGITFNSATRVPVIRAPRVLKVGIGVSKGRAIQVFLHAGKWHIRHGVWDKTGGKEKLVMKTVYQGGVQGMPNTQEAAEAWHNANKHLAVVSNRPQKLSYFTFTRRTITEDASGKPVEMFEPDFDAIAAHGDLPKRIPVVLTSENPLYQEYAWWSAAEMKCHGDGILAERALSLGGAKDPGWQAAKNAGERMFPYTPCFRGGCPHAGVDCHPHSSLNFQLGYALRLGSTAYFSTTGQVTADRLFSSLWEIRETIERLGCSIAGAPMDLVLGSFRANYQGKPTVQPYVSLELRAEGVQALRRVLAESAAWTPAMLNGHSEQEPVIETAVGVYEAAPVEAPASTSEIVEPDFEEEEEPEPPLPGAAATLQKQDEIAARLKETREQSKPWNSQIGMATMLNSVREKVGEAAFIAALGRHEITLTKLKWEDPKATMLYLDMKALLDAPPPATSAAQPLEDDDTF